MLEAGQPAPDFALPRDGGTTLSLSSMKGKAVVLYFYPKDDTSGCTLEAQNFNALKSEFAEAGAQIIACRPIRSRATTSSRPSTGWISRSAADESKDMLLAYGVWVEKSMYGRKYMGVERTTILIDRNGRIARIWPKVKCARSCGRGAGRRQGAWLIAQAAKWQFRSADRPDDTRIGCGCSDP